MKLNIKRGDFVGIEYKACKQGMELDSSPINCFLVLYRQRDYSRDKVQSQYRLKAACFCLEKGNDKAKLRGLDFVCSRVFLLWVSTADQRLPIVENASTLVKKNRLISFCLFPFIFYAYPQN